MQVFPKGLNETLTIWRLYNDWSQGKLKAWQKGQVSLKAGDKVSVILSVFPTQFIDFSTMLQKLSKCEVKA